MLANEISISTERLSTESGFGLIEVVISMSLLGILSISFIPVLTNSWKDTSTNTTIATATQIVNEQIEGARAVRSAAATSPSCQDVTAFLNVTLAPVIDPRGVTLLPQWSPTTCPSSYPGVVRAQVLVTRQGNAVPIASAVTLIFVKSAV
jgi:prepilin-type N-terminal cleavage/methylation domain-containing protein